MAILTASQVKNFGGKQRLKKAEMWDLIAQMEDVPRGEARQMYVFAAAHPDLFTQTEIRIYEAASKIGGLSKLKRFEKKKERARLAGLRLDQLKPGAFEDDEEWESFGVRPNRDRDATSAPTKAPTKRGTRSAGAKKARKKASGGGTKKATIKTKAKTKTKTKTKAKSTKSTKSTKKSTAKKSTAKKSTAKKSNAKKKPTTTKKRTALKDVGAKDRHRFTATFVRTGWARGKRTILLQDVKRGSKKLTDHLWFTMSKAFEETIQLVEPGDEIAFDARVKEYKKGYRGKDEYKKLFAPKPSTDYKLSYPTNVTITGKRHRVRPEPDSE